MVIVLDVSVQATGDDTQLFHFVDPELAKGGGTVLEIFEGHLQWGLAANQDSFLRTATTKSLWFCSTQDLSLLTICDVSSSSLITSVWPFPLQKTLYSFYLCSYRNYGGSLTSVVLFQQTSHYLIVPFWHTCFCQIFSLRLKQCWNCGHVWIICGHVWIIHCGCMWIICVCHCVKITWCGCIWNIYSKARQLD